MINNERLDQRKRKRVVAKPPSVDYCRTCRERRVKCDGERPCCGRCRTSGRECKGYASWHFQLDTDDSAQRDLTVNTIPKSPDKSPSCRVQLLANFTELHYPHKAFAAPNSAHHQDWSFLHTLLASSSPSTLLRTAMETLCLSHVAANSIDRNWMRLPFQESYTRLISMLRAAMASPPRQGMRGHHLDIASCMVALSLLPTSPTVSEDSNLHHQTHLLAAAAYLAEHGASILPAVHHFDTSLMRHIHVYLSYHCFGQRKRDPWDKAEWACFHGLVVESVSRFPVKSCYIPFRRKESEFTWYSVSKRDFMLKLVLPLPSLLADVDQFISGNGVDTDEELHMYESVVHRIDNLFFKTYKVQPLLNEDGAQQPRMIHFDDLRYFDTRIEEHAFMLYRSTFTEFYAFAGAEQASAAATAHQLSLLANCALLQVMYSAYTDKKVALSGCNIRMVDVEQHAFWHASELCRCVHYYSQRSLTAARYMISLLTCAGNFFECYGAVEEMEWCRGCVRATQARMARLQSTSTPSICRLVDVVGCLPSGCRYGPTWTASVQKR